MSAKRDVSVAIGGILGGAYQLLTGFLDPTFLFDVGLWYPVVKLFSRDLGPVVLPEMPWEVIGLIGTMAFLAAHLYRINQEEESKS